MIFIICSDHDNAFYQKYQYEDPVIRFIQRVYTKDDIANKLKHIAPIGVVFVKVYYEQAKSMYMLRCGCPEEELYREDIENEYGF